MNINIPANLSEAAVKQIQKIIDKDKAIELKVGQVYKHIRHGTMWVVTRTFSQNSSNEQYSLVGCHIDDKYNRMVAWTLASPELDHSIFGTAIGKFQYVGMINHKKPFNLI